MNNLLHHRIQWPAAASVDIKMLKIEMETEQLGMHQQPVVSHKQAKCDPGHYRYYISLTKGMNIEGGGDLL